MDFKKDVYDAIIIGSGVGGMFAGARLAHAGYDVLILEKLGRLGGRKTSKDHKGFQVQTGAVHYHLYGGQWSRGTDHARTGGPVEVYSLRAPHHLAGGRQKPCDA